MVQGIYDMIYGIPTGRGEQDVTEHGEIEARDESGMDMHDLTSRTPVGPRVPSETLNGSETVAGTCMAYTTLRPPVGLYGSPKRALGRARGD